MALGEGADFGLWVLAYFAAIFALDFHVDLLGLDRWRIAVFIVGDGDFSLIVGIPPHFGSRQYKHTRFP